MSTDGNFARFQGTPGYIASGPLVDAVNCAIALERPLLLKGEPGTGKTVLARHVAEGLGMPMLSWHIKSTTQGGRRPLRLRHRAAPERQPLRQRRRRRHPPLHQARPARRRRSPPSERHVLLIDEIDKADLEFPNDLLRELDEMRFTDRRDRRRDRRQASGRSCSSPRTTRRSCPTRSCAAASSTTSSSPTCALMRKIVAVHHPHLDAKLLDQVLIKFYWLREQSELRKKPSTSELIDWISALLRSGITHGAARGAHPVPRRAAQEGAGRRRAAALRRRKGGKLPGEAGPTSGRATISRRVAAMFLDLFYGLRDEGVPVAIQEWHDVPRARSSRGCTARACCASTTSARACLVKSETYFDAYDRVFARVFKGVEGALGDDVTERGPRVAARSEELPEPLARAAGRARAPHRPTSSCAASSRRSRAERAPRRRRPLGRHRRHVAVRPRRRASDRHPRRRAGARAARR